MIDGKRILFNRQVDDFTIAAPDAKTADILLDMLDEKLTIPIKRQGFLDIIRNWQQGDIDGSWNCEIVMTL